MQAKAHGGNGDVHRCSDLEEAVRRYEEIRATGDRATLERSREGWVVQRLPAGGDE